MIVRGVEWVRFSLPFRRAFSTSHGTLTLRVGLIVRMVTEDGAIGLGEASAVPGFGGSLAEVETTLQEFAPSLNGQELADVGARLENLDRANPSEAAVAFALDTACLDLQGQAAGIPIARLLGGDPDRPIPVHATVGAASAVDAVKAALAAVDAGFRCVKLKVGAFGSETDELTRIAAVRDALGPDVRLRLDANGGWSEAEAVAILRAAERFDLDLVEQPVAANDLAGMARVRRAVGVPIAADESATNLDRARLVVATGAADVLVVKPMLAGGLRAGRKIIDLARDAGLQAFVTTTLDTGVGAAAAVHLAATLPTPSIPCGLATGPLLAGDLVARPLPIDRGAIRVPAEAGLGVALDDFSVIQLTGPWRGVELTTRHSWQSTQQVVRLTGPGGAEEP